MHSHTHKAQQLYTINILHVLLLFFRFVLQIVVDTSEM